MDTRTSARGSCPIVVSYMPAPNAGEIASRAGPGSATVPEVTFSFSMVGAPPRIRPRIKRDGARQVRLGRCRASQRAALGFLLDEYFAGARANRSAGDPDEQR